MSKYVRLMRNIWTDQEWLDLSAASKIVYVQLISQPNISKAGVLPTVLRRWASMYPDLDVEDIAASVEDLTARGFVVVDEDTQELLVRTYMRYDEMFTQPNGRKAIASAYDEIVSDALKRIVRDELSALLDNADNVLDDSSGNPSGNPSSNTSVTPRTKNQEPRTKSQELLTADNEFDEFWTNYPRKTGKQPAQKAWGKLSEPDRHAALQAIRAHVAYWQASQTRPQFIPHPATWLNARRWEDELPNPTDTTRRPAPGMTKIREILEGANGA